MHTNRLNPSTSTPCPSPLRTGALSVCAICLSWAASPLLAQDAGPYLGLGVGQAQGSFNDQRMSDSLVTPGGPVILSNSISKDRNDTGYKLFLGYQFNRYFGAELGYFDLGKYRFTNTSTPAGQLTGEVRNEGVNLDLVGGLPVTDRFKILGRVGAIHDRTRATFAGTGALALNDTQPGRSEADMKLGLGLQYALTPQMLVRAEAEDYRVNDAAGGKGNVMLYSLSLVFPLGSQSSGRTAYSSEPAAPWVAPAPMPVAYTSTAPEPAPVMVAVAAPVVPPMRRVSYSAESLFGFDSATVRPEGKVALDGFATELQGASFVNIRVEGYSDRIGNPDYNQALSVRRAEAVKAYLVMVAKVDPGKIITTGFGEASPHSQSAECKDGEKGQTLIQCLAADRRVEIEVSGTR